MNKHFLPKNEFITKTQSNLFNSKYMTKLQQINTFLSQLHDNLFEKHQIQSVKRSNATTKAEQTKNPKDIDLAQQLSEIHEHTKGQLYEINYILEKFWDILSQEE